MFGKLFGTEKKPAEAPKVDMHETNETLKNQVENLEMRARKV